MKLINKKLKQLKNKGIRIMAAAKKKATMDVVVDEAVDEFHGYATAGSAGFDIKSGVRDKVLGGGATAIFRTGIKVAIPEGHVGLLMSRSSTGVKRGLIVAQSVGVIDSDYRGELLVPIWNKNTNKETIKFGERIAQLLIVPVVQPVITFVDELNETDRGEGGFGSTGE